MGVGQTLVFQWSCRPFADVVTKHYLPLESSTTNEIFLRLADYFNGTSVQDRSLSGMHYSIIIKDGIMNGFWFNS